MEKLASNHHQIVFERTTMKPTFEVLQKDAFTTIICTDFNSGQAVAKFGKLVLGKCIDWTSHML